MDKIRQALDKARRERSSHLAAVSIVEHDPTRSDVGSVVGRQVDAADRAAEPHEEYPVARQFVPDAATLEDRRVLPPGLLGGPGSAFRQLRTQVLQRMREKGWQTIGIASARSGDGKTTVAANLAIGIAADPRQTAVLVDLDLRNPRVAALFGYTPSAGLDDVLRGEAVLSQCFAQPAGYTNLRLLAARGAMAESSGAVASAPWQTVLAELRQRYVNRIVLVDTPPVLETDDVVTLAPMLDCLLFVVSEGRTRREDVVRALELLRGVPIVGTVLNRSVEAVQSEAYG